MIDIVTVTTIEVDVETSELLNEIIGYFVNAIYDEELDISPLDFTFDAGDFERAAGLDLYGLSNDAMKIIYLARKEAYNSNADSVRFS